MGAKLGAGNSNVHGFGEFRTKQPSCAECSPIMLVQLPVFGCCWLLGRLRSTNQGFKNFRNVGYKRVKDDEFSIDNEESLTDFLDEAEYDDNAPRIYDGYVVNERRPYRRPMEEDDRPIAGG